MARGLTNYRVKNCIGSKGRTPEIEGVLGYLVADEVIHRMISFRCETRRLECDPHTPALFGLCADGFYSRVQARLVSGRFVFMNQAMGHGSIDNRYG